MFFYRQMSGYDNKTIDGFFQNLPQLIRPFKNDVNYTKFNEMLYSLEIELKSLMFRVCILQKLYKILLHETKGQLFLISF